MSDRPSTLLGWRLLALLYDFFPLLALWFVAAAVFTFAHGDAVRGGWLGAMEFVVFLAIAGLYATLSWKRGGQTIGMRPWRLRVVADDGGAPEFSRLWRRFGMGCLSLAIGGLGFWWAWFDRDRLTWHDRASATRLVRLPKTGRAGNSLPLPSGNGGG
ncbi:RDD family protein [Thermomonas sp.]|uniref:RDD family protein n=1 Tax=Thermomonas sp. TaxID=1971895 RepID=UPI002636C58F|nr:RDD family protein [Thermomonas sp.]MCO5055609.1 RDD family protein [Thermomonas sp.]